MTYYNCMFVFVFFIFECNAVNQSDMGGPESIIGNVLMASVIVVIALRMLLSRMMKFAQLHTTIISNVTYI